MFFGRNQRVGLSWEQSFRQLRLWGLWITQTRGTGWSRAGWTVWWGQTPLWVRQGEYQCVLGLPIRIRTTDKEQ